jgi:hypothetical protein
MRLRLPAPEGGLVPWVEVHGELPDHAKVIALAQAIGELDHDRVWPKLVRLWLWCLSNRPDGILEGLGAKKIASICCWDGDPDLWLAALTARHGEFSPWVDTTPLRVHDADEYLGRWARLREGARARKRAQRERQNVTRDVTVTSQRNLDLDLENDVGRSGKYKRSKNSAQAPTRARARGTRGVQGLVEAAVAATQLSPAKRAKAVELTRRIVAEYLATWRAAYGHDGNVNERDIETVLALLLKHKVDEVSVAVHYYVAHHAGHWASRGAPLHGMESSWQEVLSDRAAVVADPYMPAKLGGRGRGEALWTCGCLAREPVIP